MLPSNGYWLFPSCEPNENAEIADKLVEGEVADPTRVPFRSIEDVPPDIKVYENEYHVFNAIAKVVVPKRALSG